jgi:tetratricopeptide (TPR) repeat protein
MAAPGPRADVARDWTAIYSLPIEALEAPATDSPAGDGAAAAAAQHPWLAAMTMGCSHDHAAEQRVFDMTTADKLAACAWMRRFGNTLFREGAYERAATLYARALVYYEYAFPDDPRDQLALNWVRLLCLLNAGACAARLGRHGDALTHSRQAVAMVHECRDLLATLPADAKAAAGPSSAVIVDEDAGEEVWDTAPLHTDSVPVPAPADRTAPPLHAARLAVMEAKAYLRIAAVERERGEVAHATAALASSRSSLALVPADAALPDQYPAIVAELAREAALVAAIGRSHARQERDVAKAMFAST